MYRRCIPLLLAGCASAAPGTPDAPIEYPEPDQVCVDDPTGRASWIGVEDLVDIRGLRDELAEVRLQLGAEAPSRRVYELIVRYGTDGRPGDRGTWHTSLTPERAERLEVSIGSRLKRLGSGLLRPEIFRFRVVFTPSTSFALVPPASCQPHIVHLPNERPTGLPDDVITFQGRMGTAGDTLLAVVRIHVDRTGVVGAVEDEEGRPEALARARQVIALLQFDPALSNGARVDGQLLQTFRFLPRVDLPPPP